MGSRFCAPRDDATSKINDKIIENCSSENSEQFSQIELLPTPSRSSSTNSLASSQTPPSSSSSVFDFNTNEFGTISSQKYKEKICKIVVLGDIASCKTQLINEYIGDSRKRCLRTNDSDSVYNLQIWDVPSNGYGTTHIYCQNAMTAVIVMDVCNENALHNVYQYISNVKMVSNEIPILLLVLNCNSCKRCFTDQDIDEFCKENISFFVKWQKIYFDESSKNRKMNLQEKTNEFIKQSIQDVIQMKSLHKSK